MSVLDSLPDGSISRLVREVETAQKEIKAPQTIGSSGVLMGITISQAAADITVPAGDGRAILLQYTPSDLSFGGGLIYRAYESVNGSSSYSEIFLQYRLRVGLDGIQSWRIPTFNQGLPEKTYKFLFIGIGSGTFTANLI
ncbi:hypothetical protein [Pseudarthrobacter sp. ATCC 49987]|uniref:hypothetical protein n=1 Tax=Pseudarthrobacter sp. ATCC 49987 TaxID=2698204 RepID=UPI00136B1F73|nr:hypothetical protein [Pseudarthrobacter sp. ATCC 49987]